MYYCLGQWSAYHDRLSRENTGICKLSETVGFTNPPFLGSSDSRDGGCGRPPLSGAATNARGRAMCIARMCVYIYIYMYMYIHVYTYIYIYI